MGQFAEPSEDNAFLADHVALLRHSFRHWTGRELADPALTDEQAARFLFNAEFVLVSHDNAADPVFNYGNRTALALFGMNWEEFTALPSRLSAEPAEREERSRLLREVGNHGFVDHHRGVRISRDGRRFLIDDATVWNLFDASGRHCGQAAMFQRWQDLPDTAS